MARDGKLKDYRYLHLATHGQLDARGLLQSRLILSKDNLPDPDEQIRKGEPLYDGNLTPTGWGTELVKRRPDITIEMVDTYLTNMYKKNPDFVLTVTRDFVRSCQTPVLIMPDDVPAHPYAVAMESAMLAPKSEVSIYPWKEPRERLPVAIRHIRTFLRANRPVST